MNRGIYTAASGMVVQMHRLDAVANNLANVDLSGYKRDTAVFKAFPEMLLQRLNDDGVSRVPIGPGGVASVDSAPMVGRIGTGVELNEVFTIFTQGAMKETENPFDLALEGQGFLAVETPQGERYTRNGSFLLNEDSYLVTKEGDRVLGENGPIRIKLNNFVIDQDGVIYHNTTFAGDDQRLVSVTENEWENMERVDRLKMVDFHRPRYLRKAGGSFWRETPESGPAEIAEGNRRPKVRQGFLEGANVNPVTEMVEMIEVNRAYEANSRMIQTEDALMGKLINEAAKV